MKIGVIGDLHFSSIAPERRLDKDYLSTCGVKLLHCLRLLSSCDMVIQAGDFFDRYTVSNRAISMAISVIAREGLDSGIFGIVGQHDLSGHNLSSYDNSPVKVLESSNLFHLLYESQTEVLPRVWDVKNYDTVPSVHLYGASFGCPVPIVNDEASGYNVLVIHAMIGDRPLFPGQELENPRAFLKNYPDYNLVICGDYHYRFIDRVDNRLIVNAGCVMRKTIADKDHKPAVLIVDTVTQEVEIKEIPIVPASEIFDFTKHEVKSNPDIDILIEKIKNSKTENIGWKNILIKVLQSQNSPSNIKEMVGSFLEKSE